MKPKLTNNKGFTLLEIIVVMIIVGVLAAIALPNLFANVERQRAQEAMTTIGNINNAIEACIQSNLGAVANCGTIANVGVTIPGNARFNYTIAGAPGGAISATGADTVTYLITACRNTAENGTACTNANTKAGTSLWLERTTGGGYGKGANGSFVNVW